MTPRIGSRVLAWCVAVAACAAIAATLVLRSGWEAPDVLRILALALPAMVASARAARGTSPAIRLAPTFFLAALLLLPLPAASVVAVVALIAGSGGGLVGVQRVGIVPFAAAAAPAVVIEAAYALSGQRLAPTGPLALGVVTAAFVLLQIAALGLGRAAGLRAHRPALVLEVVNAPLGWLVASLAAGGAYAALGVVAVLVLAAQFALARLADAVDDLRATNSALGARVTELDTLHSIGREIVSTLDPDRVVSIVDRECRKVFDVDRVVVALADPDSSELRLTWNRGPDRRPEHGRSRLDPAFTRRLLEQRRAYRVDDLEATSDAPALVGLPGADARSAMVVPLIVRGRVTGALCVHSRCPASYDDHQLAVLTTIAQQAAVALENARHYELATVDSLTGFYLRDYFFRRLAEEFRRTARYGGQFAVLMVDLDAFKPINDRHGHAVGDRYLASVARRIAEELRSADLPCRYGGDEFSILLPETDLAGALTIGDRVRAAVAGRPVLVDALVLRTTASVGIAAYPEHRVDAPTDLLRRADEALYRAKRAGRDRVVVWS